MSGTNDEGGGHPPLRKITEIAEGLCQRLDGISEFAEGYDWENLGGDTRQTLARIDVAIASLSRIRQRIPKPPANLLHFEK